MYDAISLQAYQFAREAHMGQVRKYVNHNYIVHPMRVAALVYHYLDGASNRMVREVAVPAAFLHDTVEDCDVEYDDIVDQFGVQVAKVVMEVTNPSIHSSENRKTRKAMDKEHLSHSSYFGASIKLADIIDNTSDITAFDPGFAKVYVNEKLQSLDVLQHGDPKLVDLVSQSLDEALASIQKD